jgi:hypothetical protein
MDYPHRFRAALFYGLALLLLPAAAYPVAARAGGSFSIDGPIDEHTAQRLRDEIAGRDVASATVILDSPGGLLLEGMALGRLIRQLGFSTAVARGGVCHSACVFALLGGVFRYAAPQSSIGVHRFSSGSAVVDADTVQVVAAAVVSYIRQMGADVDLFERMTRKGAGQILVLGDKELRQLRVINDGRLDAHWELQAQGGGLVLKGTQDSAQGKAQVQLSCQDDRVLFQPLFAAGEHADELVNTARRHLMRVDAGFVALAQPVEPPSANDGNVSATFVLEAAQLKRLGSSESLGYAIESSGGSSGFVVDTAGGGAESIRNFVATCCGTPCR